MASSSLLRFCTTRIKAWKNWNLLPIWIKNVLMPGIIRLWNRELAQNTGIWLILKAPICCGIECRTYLCHAQNQQNKTDLMTYFEGLNAAPLGWIYFVKNDSAFLITNAFFSPISSTAWLDTWIQLHIDISFRSVFMQTEQPSIFMNGNIYLQFGP